MKYLLIALLSVTGVQAGENHNPPPKPVTQTQHQSQGQSQESTSSASSENTNTASGGSGGSSDSQASGGNAQSTGGSSQSAIVNTYPQQVPALGQGSFAISGCQAAGNAGGANSHGAAFLGFGFTTDECYRLMLAQAYQAVGQAEAACEVLNRTDMALNLERKRGFTVPICKPREVAQPVVVAPAPVADTVTHQELQEVEHRIVEKVTQK